MFKKRKQTQQNNIQKDLLYQKQTILEQHLNHNQQSQQHIKSIKRSNNQKIVEQSQLTLSKQKNLQAIQQKEFLQKLRNDSKLQNLFQIAQGQEQLQRLTIKQAKTQPKTNARNYLKNIKNSKLNNISQQKILIQANQNNEKKEPKQINNDKQINNIFENIIRQNTIKNNKSQIKVDNKMSNPLTSNKLIILDSQDIQQPNSQPLTLQIQTSYLGQTPLSPIHSSQSHSNQFHHQQDYQDQLIRKTLTKSNYTKLLSKNNLKQTKQKIKKDKLMEKIRKIRWGEIEGRIGRDIQQVESKRNQLRQEVTYLQQRMNQRQQQSTRKLSSLAQLKSQHTTLLKAIYFLSYYGDQIMPKQSSTQKLNDFFNSSFDQIIKKLQEYGNRVGIEQLMQKEQTRDNIKEKFRAGRNKIRKCQPQDQEGLNQDEDEEEDQFAYEMDQDGF